METSYKKELVLNIRGFYICSIISSLFEKKFFQAFIKSKEINKSNKLLKKKKIKHLINYLVDIRYLLEKKQCYKFTELGYDIFSRYYAFLVPCSYHDYFLNLDKFIFSNYIPRVDRKKNIIGSGITHKRYFNSAISYFRAFEKNINIIDLGCGNGFFLETADKMLKVKKLVGLDLSKISIQYTKKIFKNRQDSIFFLSDAAHVENWSKKIKSFIDPDEKNNYFFMWFLVHEISSNSPKKIAIFLKKIKKKFPYAKFVICELLKNNFNNNNKVEIKDSIMPEYQFFHNLSDQGILSLKEYYQIFNMANIKLDKKIFFDYIDKKNSKFPSAAIFFLK
jgi:hypothetical protein